MEVCTVSTDLLTFIRAYVAPWFITSLLTVIAVQVRGARASVANGFFPSVGQGGSWPAAVILPGEEGGAGDAM